MPLSDETTRRLNVALTSPTAGAEVANKLQSGSYDPTNVVYTGTGNVAMAKGQKVLVMKKASGAATTVTLPPSPSQWQSCQVIDGNGDAGTNNITVQPAAGTIDGGSSALILTNYSDLTFLYNGTEWNVTNNVNWSNSGTLNIPAGAVLAGNSNFNLNTTFGSQIGTAANQKLGFWGVTPVVQPAGKGELLGLNGNAATAANATNMNSNGNVGNNNYGLNDIVKALKQAGLLTV